MPRIHFNTSTFNQSSVYTEQGRLRRRPAKLPVFRFKRFSIGRQGFQFRTRAPRGMVTWEIKNFFFNTPLVQEAIRRAQQDGRALNTAGGFVRLTARRSLRQVRAKPGGPRWNVPSQPGTPPRSRDRRKRMKLILYGISPYNFNVIVGPVYLKKRMGNTTTPSVHEFGKRVPAWINIGGRPTITQDKFGRKVTPAQRRAYSRLVRTKRLPPPTKPPVQFQPQRVIRIINYPERAFMWPAALKLRDKYPALWRGTIIGRGGK